MRLILLIALLLSLSSPALAESQKRLRLATTTSTDNTGLLKAILPVFEAATGFEVQVVAVGTGKALKMGRDGDVDVVLVHALSAEEKFVNDGFGLERHAVMYNQFVVIGPESDPAGIKTAITAAEAFASIATARARFISRGDNSGTYKKEQRLWEIAHIKPHGKWYMEAGQGMGKIIQIASELDAYTLTDSGTWLVYQSKSPLTTLYAGDKALFNPYGIIAVNPKRHTDINANGANALVKWITSKAGQTLIGNFRFHNNQLFIPNAAKAD